MTVTSRAHSYPYYVADLTSVFLIWLRRTVKLFRPSFERGKSVDTRSSGELMKHNGGLDADCDLIVEKVQSLSQEIRPLLWLGSTIVERRKVVK